MSYQRQGARLKKIEAELDRRRQQRSRANDRVEEATRDAFLWVTQYTQTYNPHWIEEGRSSPYEPFPALPHFAAIFHLIDRERITWWEKSRDMMMSWTCVAYLTLKAMTVPEREVLFQTQKEEKAKQLVKYAKHLYRQQPQWLKDAFPLSKDLDLQSDLELNVRNGSRISGIPGGADQIRSYHPWGYLLDEASFVVEAGESYNEALAAVKGKIILNSSAGPGWFADARRDIVKTTED